MTPARAHAARAPRGDSRLPRILDAAAAQFARKGYEGATIRDIVRVVGILPGSLYYHFENKDELLVAVYAEGVRRIGDAVRAAIGGSDDPWRRLQAACAAHLESLLVEGDYAQVVVRVRPDDAPAVAPRLVALRDDYERIFVGLLAALDLPPRTDRTALRMLLLGALNWTQTWYRPGKRSPRRIANSYLNLLRTLQ
ncbi:MAG TPA: TetR/AcrR family transcriptional regulator [Burkholderiaceae bacterium]|nr:TetR/AcrR family transcriptional regulator [Burkholderiaceae bacterium]